MQMSNMSVVDVRGFGNKLFIWMLQESLHEFGALG